MKTNNHKATDAWLERHGNEFGRVVEIFNMVTGDSYIGHTKKPATRLLYQARAACNQGREGLLYESMREWGRENFDVKTLYECTEDDDVIIKTREFIRMIKPSLNRN